MKKPPVRARESGPQKDPLLSLVHGKGLSQRPPSVIVGPIRTLEETMKSLLFFVGVLAVWYILNRWILPRFGIET
jgi:hypothetical protein